MRKNTWRVFVVKNERKLWYLENLANPNTSINAESVILKTSLPVLFKRDEAKNQLYVEVTGSLSFEPSTKTVTIY